MDAVLVVDDETAVRALSMRWLAAGGYRAVAAASADEALAMFEAEPAGVVICDVQMPGHDGVWLASRIRQLAPDTAVIMATGGQDIESAVAAIRLGVRDYLTKPFGRDRLLESVSGAMAAYTLAVSLRLKRAAAMNVLRPLLDDNSQLDPQARDGLAMLLESCEFTNASGR